jgi:ligand-binding sensor domain-containing protein
MKTPILIILLTFFSYGVKAQPNTDSSQNTADKPITFKKTFGPEPDPSGQVSIYIRRMLQDRDSNIWFGTQGDGACRYDGNSLVYITPGEGLSGSVVRGMLQDENGDIWFATNAGVSRYNPASGKFFNLSEAEGLSSNAVWCIAKDRNGLLWIGSEGGVDQYDPVSGSIRHFPLPAAKLADFPGAYQAPKLVNSIFSDRQGNTWLCTNGLGVYRYDGKSLRNYSEKDSLCNNFVQCVMEDDKGDLWFGTRFGGISRYDAASGRFSTIPVLQGPGSNFIWTIYQNREGKLFFGTAGGGLCSYDPATGACRRYTQADGLGNLYIQSILEDKNGNLWIGTSGGVYRLMGVKFVNFTKNDIGC